MCLCGYVPIQHTRVEAGTHLQVMDVSLGKEGRGRRPKSLPLQRPATPTTVGELFGIGPACLLVVEEHPSVLTFDPPELSPEVSSLLAEGREKVEKGDKQRQR